MSTEPQLRSRLQATTNKNTSTSDSNVIPTTHPRPSRLRRIHVESLFWVILASVVAYISEWPLVAYRFDTRLSRFWLVCSIPPLIGFCATYLYLTFILPYAKKPRLDPVPKRRTADGDEIDDVSAEWAIHAPFAIPFATICGVVFMGTCVCAWWPVYGWWTLPIGFVSSMAAVTVLSWL